jgi:hypothetical protein
MTPKPKVRLYHITHQEGLEEVISAPFTSRVTIYTGRGASSQASVVRIYMGSRLIAYFPSVSLFYELGSVSHTPTNLADHKAAQDRKIPKIPF